MVGDLHINPDTREVKRGKREIELTNREFELLEYLARNQKLVVSRERLLEDVWGYDPFEQTNTIDVFISNLRRKLESGGEPRLLHTKRGAGYVLKARGVKWAQPWRLPLFERIPVRWRIAITTAGLTLLILVVFALVLGQVVGNRIRSDFRDGATQRAARSLAARPASQDTPSEPSSKAPNSASVRAARGRRRSRCSISTASDPLAADGSATSTSGPRAPASTTSADSSVATEPITGPGSLPASSSTRDPTRASTRPSPASGSSSAPECSAARCSPCSPGWRSPTARCARSRR